MLHRDVERIASEAGVHAWAAALHDFETSAAWSFHGDRWFHAASTMKVAVLLALFAAAEEGLLALDDRLHVRNRFLSVVDGEPYRVGSDREADAALHRKVGKLVRLHELALPMITTSSNLATNLLVDLLGIERIETTLAKLGISGVEVRRGVEDHKAFEAGINNRITANGYLAMFRLLEEGRGFSPESREAMLEILHAQQLRSGLPARLPEGATVANKTGEISTVAHDGGLVYITNRKPYALVLLSEWEPGNGDRRATLAKISRLIYDDLVGTEAPVA